MSQQASPQPCEELLFASLAANNTTHFYRALAAYLSRRLSRPIRLIEDVPWPERERRLRSGAAHLGVVCGLQYVYAQQRCDEPGLELLAAAVMRAPRYQARPIYFSDVVVRRDHPARSFDDLRGSRWAYNEPTSHSGYNITRYMLARRGYHAGFFGRAVETGAHERSLEQVLDGTVDASAIDSTVLEQELRTQPALASRIRVVARFAESPIPPLVVSRTVPEVVRADIRQVLLQMHHDTAMGEPSAEHILAAGAIQRFVRVVDADYDVIRSMAEVARLVRLDVEAQVGTVILGT
jgi:phosphonate transport system substrate-binding protein